GGTLGILIPPSVVLVLYAVLTEQSVGKMFVAALLPGLLAVLGYMVAASFSARGQGARDDRPADTGRLRALAAIWPVAAIFALVIGGIYGGWFTPTEGAAVGAGSTGLLALARRRLDRAGLAECLLETATISAMIFLILLGAEIFNAALALSHLPQLAADAIAGAGWPPLAVVAAVLVLFLVLGCVMDSLSMILLTVPILFPVIAGLDLGLPAEEVAIWFGILALVAVEVGLITPPVGLNVFVINALAEDVPLSASFRGVLPFFLSDLARIVLLVAFPGLSLWLVRLLE
ncbi:MAG: TRAP transporter large permease, partial [Alphaproteobacteria bacterium]